MTLTPSPSSILVYEPVEDEVGLTEAEMTFQFWLERQLDQFADEPEPEGLVGIFTDVGWQPDPDHEMTLKEWLFTFAKVLQVHEVSPILLGDLLNEGKQRFGEVYAQAMKATAYAYFTLTGYSYATRNVPIEVRPAGTTLSHMAVVAPLRDRPDLQRQWLKRAVLNGWSARWLRKERDKGLPSKVTDSTVVDGATGEIIETPATRLVECPKCGCHFEIEGG